MFLLRRLTSDCPRTFNFETLVCIVKSVLFKSSLLVICVWLNPLAFSFRYWESLRSSCRDVSSTCINKLLEACNKLNFSCTSWFNCYIVGVVCRFLGWLVLLRRVCIFVKIAWIDVWSYLTWFLKISVCERESREVIWSFWRSLGLCLLKTPSCFTTLFFDFLPRSTVCNNWFESIFWICCISWFSESWLIESNEWFSSWWCEPALENFPSFSADLEGSSFSICPLFAFISVICGSISSFFGLRVWSSLLEGFGLTRI